MKFLNVILEDAKANKFNPRSCLIVILYRMANFFSVWRKKNILNNLWCVPYLIFYRFLSEFVLNCEIPAATKIGRRLVVHHGYSIVINKNSIIGDDFSIRQSVTIGNKGLHNLACPIIGNFVSVGASSVIIGGVKIGDNVFIGAGTVVVNDIPSNSIVVGQKSLCKESK